MLKYLYKSFILISFTNYWIYHITPLRYKGDAFLIKTKNIISLKETLLLQRRAFAVLQSTS